MLSLLLDFVNYALLIIALFWEIGWKSEQCVWEHDRGSEFTVCVCVRVWENELIWECYTSLYKLKKQTFSAHIGFISKLKTFKTFILELFSSSLISSSQW